MRLKAFDARLSFVHRLNVVIHYSLDPVFEQDDVKVDEQPDGYIQEPQMRKKLRLIDGMQRVFALEFNDNAAVDQKVRPESAVELDGFINQRNRLLPLHSHA